ncbi:5-formyltetrahydrofolate cyclo-ligase [Neopusillimonas maritima]|jgi:5,10-methenyltetrahydrofolate synthetase|uniref:5-formyltetrahydrofolate cyclo-ligase n=1 Tax=Neopusillimonas maritima TaxID=2026239 RepID=A0ABX9MUS8_9BURK|nr:5-formyltetrahydrofolate cyclo-ligase [Neopusillimonas maritima]MAL02588.1 5-formyltetrahydrofolate cyclo-ligase [Alcaligenaceae bacterium]RII82326.1 5-formyltetrahydrofolate cyclo-ligase [Neopusillimonas maritima]
MTDSIENNPDAIRDRLKAARAAQDPIETRRGGLLIRGRLYTWLATTRAEQEERGEPTYQNVAAFWSMPEEPQLQPLLYQWVEEEGISVSLPVVTGPDQPLEFRIWTPDTPMQTGAFGISEPQGPVAPTPDVVLVPTLGYTRKGDRIGYGKGYYDRTLAHLKKAGHSPYAMGVAWACGDLERMGVQHTPLNHDYPLNAILTDKGWALK